MIDVEGLKTDYIPYTICDLIDVRLDCRSVHRNIGFLPVCDAAISRRAECVEVIKRDATVTRQEQLLPTGLSISDALDACKGANAVNIIHIGDNFRFEQVRGHWVLAIKHADVTCTIVLTLDNSV